MRFISILIAAALSAYATQARAQDQGEPSNPVAACLASAQPDARRACIGVVAGPCMDEPAGFSTVGMINCFTRERDLWAAEAARLTALLRGRESPTQLAQLDAMLAAYEPWMRARCAYSASMNEGGSMARIVSAACVRTTNAELAIDLLERFDEG